MQAGEPQRRKKEDSRTTQKGKRHKGRKTING